MQRLAPGAEQVSVLAAFIERSSHHPSLSAHLASGAAEKPQANKRRPN